MADENDRLDTLTRLVEEQGEQIIKLQHLIRGVLGELRDLRSIVLAGQSDINLLYIKKYLLLKRSRSSDIRDIDLRQLEAGTGNGSWSCCSNSNGTKANNDDNHDIDIDNNAGTREYNNDQQQKDNHSGGKSVCNYCNTNSSSAGKINVNGHGNVKTKLIRSLGNDNDDNENYQRSSGDGDSSSSSSSNNSCRSCRGSIPFHTTERKLQRK